MSTYVYDVESLKNFFSVTLKDVNNPDHYIVYEISRRRNDMQAICDLFRAGHFFVGYNSTHFDDPLMQFILNRASFFANKDEDTICAYIQNKASEIIHNDKSKYTNVSFLRFDLMRIGNLKKSLKMCGVNLKHRLIQDMPVSHEETLTEEQMAETILYNMNDVEITYLLYLHLRPKILLRQKLTSKYGIYLMNEPDSGIANRILERDYAQATSTPVEAFRGKNTSRDSVLLGDVISDKIYFQTDRMRVFLEKLKATEVKQHDKVEFKVRIGGTNYDIAQGGIHSNMPAEIIHSTDTHVIRDADVSSYYPRIMINEGVKPEHLSDAFLPLLNSYTETRLMAKSQGDKVAADGLKIVINSIYGKMGNDYHFLGDPKAMYQVTLNGQLYLLMLIEELERLGIRVFYANTDGITCLVPRGNREQTYADVCQQWQDETGFELEFADFKKCIIRDVNNYLWIPEEGKPKYKGFFDIDRWKDVAKSFDKPIVPFAVYKYFTEDIPVEKTITEHQDIHDFCMAQKVGGKFEVYFDRIDRMLGEVVTEALQDTNRYYIGFLGGRIYKKQPHRLKEINLVSGEPVHIVNTIDENTAIKHYNIKYSYYIQEAKKIINLFSTKQGDLFS